MAQVANRNFEAQALQSHYHANRQPHPSGLPYPPHLPPTSKRQRLDPDNQQHQNPYPLQKGPLRTDIAAWGLPIGVVNAYANKGVKQLFPWQAAALECGEDGHNLVYCAPTSGGKSLVADVLMIRRMIQAKSLRKPGKALVVLPYISIVMEKEEHLQTIMKPMRATVRGYYGTDESRAPLAIGGEAVAICTMEKANVAVNRLAQEGRLNEISCVVIDELHMIADSGRGVGLELMLTKLLHHPDAQDVQIIGMSATMGGLETLSKWLKSRLFVTNYRPVPLSEHAVFKGVVYEKTRSLLPELHPLDGQNVDPAEIRLGGRLCPMQHSRDLPPSPDLRSDPDYLIPLIDEVTREGHSVLVFCASRKACEKTGATIARLLPQTSDAARLAELQQARLDLLAEISTAMGAPVTEDLQRAILAGIAWHHAGLTNEEKKGIENGYRAGTLQVLTATSTLAAGVNLPARRVILKSLAQGIGPVERAQYLQMIGRAGRAGQSAVGEAFIIGKGAPNTSDEWLKICKLITQPVPCLQSRLLEGLDAAEFYEQPDGKWAVVPAKADALKHLERLLLESIACSAVSSSSDIERLLRSTFSSHQLSFEDVLAKAAKVSLRTLRYTKGLIEAIFENGTTCWKSSPRGTAVYDSALPSHVGLLLYNEVQSAVHGSTVDNPLHLIYFVLVAVPHEFVICNWNSWRKVLESLKPPVKEVAQAVGVLAQHALAMCGGSRLDAAVIERHARFAAAMVINESASGEDGVDKVASRWGAEQFISRSGITRGQIQKLQGEVAKSMAMAALLCESAGWWPLSSMFAHYADSIGSGVRRELLPLMEISGLTAGEARALWKAGITEPMGLATADEAAVVKALAAGMAGTMRSKAVGGKVQQGGLAGSRDDGGATRAARIVAYRAAKSLISAAKQHLIEHNANSEHEDGYEDQLVAEGTAEGAAAPAKAEPLLGIDTEQHQVAKLKEGVHHAATGQVICTEISASTSDSIVAQFLEQWSQQKRRWAIAVIAPLKRDPKAIFLSVCWGCQEVYFIDLFEAHRSRPLQDCALGECFGEAVAKILSDKAGSVLKIVFNAHEVVPLLARAEVPIDGKHIFDLKVASYLVSPPPTDAQVPPITFFSVFKFFMPPHFNIQVSNTVRSGVTTLCRQSLSILVASERALNFLDSLGLAACFGTVDMPAVFAVARGTLSNTIDNRLSMSDSAGSADGLSEVDSRLICSLDALEQPRFGFHSVSVASMSLQQELLAGILPKSSIIGVPVAAWCTQGDLLGRPVRGDSCQRLVIGQILREEARPVRMALDFLPSGDSQSLAQTGAPSALESSNSCGPVTILVPALPPDCSEPDSSLFMPFAVEITIPAEKLWRLDVSSSATQGLLPPEVMRQCAAAAVPHPQLTTPAQAYGWYLEPSAALDTFTGPNSNLTWLSVEILDAELATLAQMTGDADLRTAAMALRPWERVSAIWGITAGGVTAGSNGVFISASTAAAVVKSLVHGWSARRLAQSLNGRNIQAYQATSAVNSFLDAFPAVREWQNELTSKWQKCHEVSTMAGRKHRLQDTSRGEPKLKGRLSKLAIAAALGGSLEDVLVAAVGAVGSDSNAAPRGVLVGQQGRVILMQVENDSVVNVERAVRQALGGLHVGLVHMTVPVQAAIGRGPSLHPLSRIK